MAQSSLSFQRELKGYLKITMKITTKTGLMIRMPIQAQAFKIGGADQYPIVTSRKYLINNEEIELEVPYIPGSSLKGRIRSLLEIAYGKKLYTTDQKIWQHVRGTKLMNSNDFYKDVVERCPIDDLFGWAAANYEQIKEHLKKEHLKDYLTETDNPEQKLKDLFSNLAPTRLLFDDFYPSKETVEKLKAKSIADFLEEKSENRIDRITSAAEPRTFPRVKPGVEFEGTVTMLIFDIDKDHLKKYLETFANGLKLVEDTYLGSSGSRGYGRVGFEDIVIELFKINKTQSGVSVVKQPTIAKLSSLEDLRSKLDEITNDITSKLFSEDSKPSGT
jgi:CRISPR-associated protein Csm3